MAKTIKPINQQIVKTKPTIFPLGFAITQVEKSFVVIDFVDQLDGRTVVLESIALPTERAAQLSQALKDALEDDNSED